MKEIRKNPMYPYLMVLVLSAMAGFQGWRTLLNNFAVEEATLSGFQIGVVQSLREVPGFLVFLVVFVLLLIREHKLAAISVLVMGLGIALVGFFPSFPGLIFTTVLMSIGFHYFETTNKSLTLQHFNTTQAPIVFAKLRSFGALTNIIVGALVWAVSDYLPYKYSFLFIGLCVVAAGIFALTQNPIKKEPVAQHKKIILRKKYWLFYVLNLLGGARRQIFVVFAVFLLVERYHFTVKEIAILFVINNILAYFFNPLIAKWINKYGERKVLSLEYIGLFFIFLGYAYFQNRYYIAGLYLLDHLFFNFSIGISTYLQKIADPRDIAPSASAGFAINHIMAVVVPVMGGLLWMVDFRIPFVIGAGLSVVSLGFVQQIRTKAAAV
ncbi:MFS transporter [uncultured Draconibacterium sp.]|uniref:MFS transporter n=1 Tax=uncultured Draconibacterium sp. TaxID=1573823 RepID=UPI003216F6F3